MLLNACRQVEPMSAEGSSDSLSCAAELKPSPTMPLRSSSAHEVENSAMGAASRMLPPGFPEMGLQRRSSGQLDSRRCSGADQCSAADGVPSTSRLEMPTPPMRTPSASGMSRMFKSASGLSIAMQRTGSVCESTPAISGPGQCSAPSMFCCCEVRGPAGANGDRKSPGSSCSGSISVLMTREDGPSVARKYSCVNDVLKELNQKNAALRSMNAELLQAREAMDDKDIEMQMVKEQHDQEVLALRRELAALKQRLAASQPQAAPREEAPPASGTLSVDVTELAGEAGGEAEAGHHARTPGSRRNSSETSCASSGTGSSDLPNLISTSSTASCSSLSSLASAAQIGSPDLPAPGRAPRSPPHTSGPPAAGPDGGLAAPGGRAAAAGPSPSEAGVVSSLLSELPLSSSWSLKFARQPPTIQDLFQRIRALEISNGELRSEVTMKDELITLLKRGKPASPGPACAYRAAPVPINSPRPYAAAAPAFPWN